MQHGPPSGIVLAGVVHRPQAGGIRLQMGDGRVQGPVPGVDRLQDRLHLRRLHLRRLQTGRLQGRRRVVDVGVVK